MYFLSMDTWNISCTLESEGGKANLYATRPIRYRILKSLIKRGLCLPLRPNIRTPFIGATFRNTMFSTSNARFLRLTSAQLFCLHYAVRNLALIFYVASFVMQANLSPTSSLLHPSTTGIYTIFHITFRTVSF